MSAEPPPTPGAPAPPVDADLTPLTAFPHLWRSFFAATLLLLAIVWAAACRVPSEIGAPVLNALGWLPMLAVIVVFGVPSLQLWWRALSDRRVGRRRSVGWERDDLDYAGRLIGFIGYAVLRQRPLLGALAMTGYYVALLGVAHALAGLGREWISAAAALDCRSSATQVIGSTPGNPILVGAILLASAVLEWRLLRSLVGRIRHALRVFGLARALSGMWLMLKLRNRQPMRDMLNHIPGLNGLACALLFLIFVPLVGPTHLVLALGLVCAVAALFRAGSSVLPPTLLLLCVTGERQFLLMRFLARTAPGFAVTLIDQKDPKLYSVYYWHYGEMVRHEREQRRGLGRLLPGTASLAMNPAGPRSDNIRTRHGYWRKSVRDVVRFVPWIVVDTRQGSPNIDTEIVWILDSEYVDKALFVTGDDGEQQSPGHDPAIGHRSAGTGRPYRHPDGHGPRNLRAQRQVRALTSRPVRRLASTLVLLTTAPQARR